MSFRALLDQLAAESSTRDWLRQMDSDAKRSEVRHRQMRKSFSAINDQLGIMVKAHAAARQLAAKQREAEREAGRQRFADFVVKANAAAASGKLTGEEAAKLDGLIARFGDRFRG